MKFSVTLAQGLSYFLPVLCAPLHHSEDGSRTISRANPIFLRNQPQPPTGLLLNAVYGAPGEGASAKPGIELWTIVKPIYFTIIISSLKHGNALWSTNLIQYESQKENIEMWTKNNLFSLIEERSIVLVISPKGLLKQPYRWNLEKVEQFMGTVQSDLETMLNSKEMKDEFGTWYRDTDTDATVIVRKDEETSNTLVYVDKKHIATVAKPGTAMWVERPFVNVVDK